MDGIKVDFDYIPNADGSCRLTRGKESVICGLIGPELVNFGTDPVNLQWFDVGGEKVKRLDHCRLAVSIVEGSLSEEDMGSCQLGVIIHELYSNVGFDLVLNAIGLAMLTSGVSMKRMFAAKTVTLDQECCTGLKDCSTEPMLITGVVDNAATSSNEGNRLTSFIVEAQSTGKGCNLTKVLEGMDRCGEEATQVLEALKAMLRNSRVVM